MNALNVAACLLLAMSLAGGQILFKFAAMDLQERISRSWLHAIWSPWLIGSLLVYAVSTALWLWILTRLPLSRAYPFALLGTALVPLLAKFIFNESLPMLYLFGAILFFAGLVLIQIS